MQGFDMRKLLGILTLAAALLAACSVSEEGQDVRIATNAPYKPMEYQSPDGSFHGFDIDLGHAMCRRAGLRCTWVNQAWEALIPGLMVRKHDAIMAAMTVNDERRKHLKFSDSYLTVASSFFVASDSDLTRISPRTLAGLKIGVQRGTVQDDYVSKKLGRQVEVKRYQNAEDIAVDLNTGRLDAAFMDQITGQSSLIQPYRDKFKQIGPDYVKPRKYFGEGMAIAFRADDDELAAKFNKALAELKADGTYARIYRKYFHRDPPQS